MIIGYILGYVMGMTLGLLGAGGSILTVPILVYLFQVPPLTATAYSLVVVGTIALVGAWRYYRLNLVVLKAVLIFCIPSITAVLLTRTLIIPRLPKIIFHWDGFALTKDAFILILFALLMLLSSFYMWRRAYRISEVNHSGDSERPVRIGYLMMSCAAVGMITGLVGAGGGFLIVPTLTGMFKLPVKQSIGTSLAIIACNSLSGFNGDLLIGMPFDWNLLSKFLIVTLAGMISGTLLSKVMESSQLYKLFASFTFAIAVSMLTEQWFSIQH